jgi:hypothetical protein
MQHFILDAERRVVPTDLLAWGERAGTVGSRDIARTQLRHLLVLTSFAGIDISFGEGSPAYFETRVLDEFDALDCLETSSWDDALVAHQALANRWGAWVEAASDAAERALERW